MIIDLYFHKTCMLYQMFCMLLIRFWELDIFEVITIDGIVHTRTLEDDSNKNHRATKMRDPSLYISLILIYDGRKPKARVAEIVTFWSFENLENLLKARFVVCLFLLLIEKFEFWTYANVEDYCFVSFISLLRFLNIVTKALCYIRRFVCFDETFLFWYVWGLDYQ